MNRKRNIYKLIILAVIVLLAMAAYMTIGVKFHNERLMRFAFKIRYPKLIAMVITAFTIGGASIVFQSVINNTIVKLDFSSNCKNIVLLSICYSLNTLYFKPSFNLLDYSI